MMTRQMPSTVSRGRSPAWRSTSRRIMSASRAGRNAEPVSAVFLVCIRRPMISLRSIRRACIAASMRSISARSSARSGGRGLISSIGSSGCGGFAGAPSIRAGRREYKKTLTVCRGSLSKPFPNFQFPQYLPAPCSFRAAFVPDGRLHEIMAELKAVTGRGVPDRMREADPPQSLVVRFGPEAPLKLDAGVALSPFQVAYQTYGTLNAARTNTVLVCHALTGDQHVFNRHPLTGKPGWWETMIGPGKPIDTERYFVVCANVLGACMGTTGPASTHPVTGMPWGLDFPVITIRDMVRAQAMLLDRLGIDTVFAVVGGSMGGMQALQWTAAYPKRVFSTLAIACSTRHSAQNIAFHELGRQAVMADPDWHGGRYFEQGTHPHRGLGVARMAAPITYLSDAALHRKFGRRMQDRELPTFSFDADFQVESYLRYQGSSFVERFDANSYLYLTRAMDYFDIAADHNGVLAQAFRGIETRFCVVSFTSDWLFPTSEARAIVHALNASSARVSFAEIETDRGHDAFLLDVPEFFEISRAFLESAAKARGLVAAGNP